MTRLVTMVRRSGAAGRFFPTVCELSEVDAPKGLQGYYFTGMLREQSGGQRQYAITDRNLNDN